MFRSTVTSLTASLLLVAGAAQASNIHSVTDFSQGTGGWEGPNPWEPVEGIGTWVDPSLGAVAPALRTVVPEAFFVQWNNNSPLATGDFTQGGNFSFSVDINVLALNHAVNGLPTERDLILELRDYDRPPEWAPYTSVWFNLGTIQGGQGWQTYSVTITDTLATEMPAGWTGYGAEDDSGASILPEGISFTDVLRGIDEVNLGTARPGFYYGWTSFDIALDNIVVSTSPVPEPAALALNGLGLAVIAGLLRRRRQSAG